MKTLLIWALAGALGGIATASVIVPPALSWYSAPGGLPKGAQIQAIVEIPEVIRYSTGRLIRGQAIGAGVGAILGVVAGVVGRRKRSAAQPVQGTVRPPASEPPHPH